MANVEAVEKPKLKYFDYVPTQELFEQFNSSQNGGSRKNTETRPIAIRCDQDQFLFIYNKHAGTPITKPSR